jgi:predicted membrane-bound dolichyl-phosphate-mannose-protein mannosyltransferase
MSMHSNQREHLSLTYVTGNHILYSFISQFMCLFTYTVYHHVDKMLRREEEKRSKEKSTVEKRREEKNEEKKREKKERVKRREEKMQ